jgi:hypothetical protein
MNEREGQCGHESCARPNEECGCSEHLVGARKDDREVFQTMRTPVHMMILKAAAGIAYPWLLALVKISRCLGNLCG